MDTIFRMAEADESTETTLEDEIKQLRARVAELEAERGKDPLTGLNNRLRMDKIIAREISRVTRNGNDKLSVLMLDIDNFKKINDEYGHFVGDEVLKKVACFIKEIIRKADVPFRYGGEEFLILLPDTFVKGAKLFAERIRLAIKEHTFYCTIKGSFNCTISGGVAGWDYHQTQDTLMKRADDALYQSKHNGRNRITVAK
ncbi:GGDEF domain-containing protein [Candidatus Falkowbacteria bacterium]|jgi:diguanylate cyclase (GGDEF)-like protein|nr:GGDEF domain-containing protein [Candidatus Falkowbacteria bacterium]MBT4433471.1 GGDEF domain-containing protein [Candidatus Falkowbacteria bacterium]